MSEKTKVSKQLAKSIEDIEYNSSNDQLYDLSFISSQANSGWESCKNVMTFVQSVGRAKYFELLVNGYEVELTPEEKVRNYFNETHSEYLDAITETLGEQRLCGRIDGILETLHLLGITIEGVNVNG